MYDPFWFSQTNFSSHYPYIRKVSLFLQITFFFFQWLFVSHNCLLINKTSPSYPVLISPSHTASMQRHNHQRRETHHSQDPCHLPINKTFPPLLHHRCWGDPRCERCETHPASAASQVVVPLRLLAQSCPASATTAYTRRLRSSLTACTPPPQSVARNIEAIFCN